MANIQFKNLERKVRYNSNAVNNDKQVLPANVIYKDLKLDIKQGVYNTESINSSESLSEIESSNNFEAVLNSVKNWFRTTEYSRLLNPELKTSPESYLFEGATETTAWFLGDTIMNSIPVWEPRVRIDKCSITVNHDEGYFIIDLRMSVPSLNNMVINLKELLNNDGFTTL